MTASKAALSVLECGDTSDRTRGRDMISPEIMRHHCRNEVSSHVVAHERRAFLLLVRGI